MNQSIEFQSGQIVCLEHDETKLFASVIQVVESRQLCWVRPLMLVTNEISDPVVTDLGSASDLLFPESLFRPALDTEVIAFYSQILDRSAKTERDLRAKQQFNHFIHLVCQAHNNAK